jgi:N6-adenosine-specific RNA methylase IME4
MELGRECLELWGYERVDELIWVKTNQLQRIIRTGRTGYTNTYYYFLSIKKILLFFQVTGSTMERNIVLWV